MHAEYVRGLRTAASYLRGTAADYDQMAKQAADQRPAMDVPGLRAAIKQEVRMHEEKATLLRGQAAQIESLK